MVLCLCKNMPIDFRDRDENEGEKGLEFSSVVECLFNMFKALSLLPSPPEKGGWGMGDSVVEFLPSKRENV